MRRSRAGQTPPHLRNPSMPTRSGNVGQCETTCKTKSIAEEETRPSSACNSDYRQRKTSKPNLPTRHFDDYSIPAQILPFSKRNLPTQTTISAATPTSATLPDRPSSKLPGIPGTTTTSTDDDATDDDLPASCTISHNPREPIQCIHTITSTKPYHPKRILGSPYRKTMLSLLCRVRTEPTDAYATNRVSAATGRIQVYACYQQHWNPEFNIPVLTIVVSCNTNVSQPILERCDPEKFSITIFCTSQAEQSKLVFDMPLFTTLDRIAEPLVLKLGPHHPLPDSLTSWFVKTADADTALTWIKVWQLSPVGCYTLHNQGILFPQRPFPEAEVHILGLTGKRKMPYRMSQLELDSPLLQLLDPVDLGNIGYRKFRCSMKPTLPNQGTLIATLPERLFPRPCFSPEWYYDQGLIKQAEHKLNRWPHFEPRFYPPPTIHIPNIDEFPKPVLFQEGEPVFRSPLILPTTTVEDMITEATRKAPRDDPIITLMTYFNIKRTDFQARHLQMPFAQFLQKHQLQGTEHNGKCLFNAIPDGHNTGELHLIPRSWYSIDDHPILGKKTITAR